MKKSFNEKNMKYKLPNILLATYVVLVLIALLYTAHAITIKAIVQPYNVLNDVNTYRLEKGLEPLEQSIMLCGLAYVRSQQIQTDWSHNQFYKEIQKVQVGGRFHENLARFYTPDEVVPAWKLSKAGHNEAMLVDDMKYGCVVQSEEYYVFEGLTPSYLDQIY